MKNVSRAAVAAVLLASQAASAAQRTVSDSDWPCQQVKVGELSPAAFWAGPPVDTANSDWRSDRDVAPLTSDISERRMPLIEAEARLSAFAERHVADRAEALSRLFAGVFSVLNGERASVIAGLDRFGRRQKALAENLRAEGEALRAAQAASPVESPQVAELSQKLAWDMQLFEARRKSNSFACNVPTVIEQRLYALSQAIQKYLE